MPFLPNWELVHGGSDDAENARGRRAEISRLANETLPRRTLTVSAQGMSRNRWSVEVSIASSKSSGRFLGAGQLLVASETVLSR